MYQKYKAKASAIAEAFFITLNPTKLKFLNNQIIIKMKTKATKNTINISMMMCMCTSIRMYHNHYGCQKRDS